MKYCRTISPLALIVGLAAAAISASAQVEFHVNVDTHLLTAGDTYYAEFTLSDGAVAGLGMADTNNSVLLDHFNLGTGMIGPVLAPNIGNASGDMNSSVMLADGDPTSSGVADLTQAFTPGSNLNFDVHLPTTNVDAGPVPDMFTIRFLNSSLNQFSDALFNPSVELDLTSPNLGIGDVATHATVNPDAGREIIPAPVISSLATTATPEFGSVFSLGGLLAAGGAGLWIRRRGVRKSRL
jgi:hypothetical protein